MGLHLVDTLAAPANPLDVAEEIFDTHHWTFERTGDGELVAEATGRWCSYHMVLRWRGALGSLELTGAFDLRVPRERKAAVYELLSMANDRMGTGHFEVTTDACLPAFRHTLLLRGASGASVEQLEDIVDIAVAEIDRFYPAFQSVVWGGRRPAEAIAAVMLEAVGEA